MLANRLDNGDYTLLTPLVLQTVNAWSLNHLISCLQAKLARMAPEARQKAEEKLQRQQAKKAMKGRVVRM